MQDFNRGANQGMGFGCGCLTLLLAAFSLGFALLILSFVYWVNPDAFRFW